jgi:hypothetical protein
VKVLLSTFGFDGVKVTEAMRFIAYDRLVLITSQDNTFTSDYRQLLDLNALAGMTVETLIVDKFDLMEAREAIASRVRELQRGNHEVALNVSGGTRILSSAAILAAFETGIDAYHASDRLVRLPVLKKVSFEERLTAQDRDALLAVRDSESINGLRMRQGQEGGLILGPVLRLKKMGLVEARVGRDGVRVCLTALGTSTRVALLRSRRE